MYDSYNRNHNLYSHLFGKLDKHICLRGSNNPILILFTFKTWKRTILVDRTVKIEVYNRKEVRKQPLLFRSLIKLFLKSRFLSMLIRVTTLFSQVSSDRNKKFRTKCDSQLAILLGKLLLLACYYRQLGTFLRFMLVMFPQRNEASFQGSL